MTALALDDEWPSLDILEAYCQRQEELQLLGRFTNPEEARQFLTNHPVDLLFLDINMPAETGLHFIRSVSPQTLVIFTTAFREYAVESYDVQAVDYLLKPFSFARFAQAVERAQTRINAAKALSSQENAEPASILLRADHGLVKVLLHEIRFIEGYDNYLKIHLLGNRTLVLRLTLKALLDMLPPENFLRVHRSYIIALDKVEAVRSRLIHMGQQQIAIGSSFEKDFLTRFKA